MCFRKVNKSSLFNIPKIVDSSSTISSFSHTQKQPHYFFLYGHGICCGATLYLALDMTWQSRCPNLDSEKLLQVWRLRAGFLAYKDSGQIRNRVT